MIVTATIGQLELAGACQEGIDLFRTLAPSDTWTGEWTALHAAWLARDYGEMYSWCTERSVLPSFPRYASLRESDLAGADLRDSDLRDADLRQANLIDANLNRADLRDADLRDTSMLRADLRGADLTGANLTGANLTGVVLAGAIMPDGRVHQ